jgi:lipopolysaccharide export system permease protein
LFVVKIIDKYIIKEFIPPFLLGLLLFTFVLLINKIFRLTELVVNKGVSLWEVAKLVSYIMPSFLTITIPMAVLLAALVAFGRFSTDCETTAFKATGFSAYRLMAPVLALALGATLLTSYFSLYLGPEKARSFKRDLFVLAKSKAFSGLEEETFNDSFKNFVIYAQKTPSPNEMHGVFISDERNPAEPYVIIAQAGVMDLDFESGCAYLNLTNGSIHKRGTGKEKSAYQEINFDKNTVTINLYDKFFSESLDKKGKREMSLGELRKLAGELNLQADKKYPLLTEYYKRFTVPFACIVFGIIGPPLGMYSRRSGKSAGITVALAIFALYYTLMKGGENLASGGNLNPLVAVLLPNLMVGALGVYLTIMTAREKSVTLDSVKMYVDRIRRNFKARRLRG